MPWEMFMKKIYNLSIYGKQLALPILAGHHWRPQWNFKPDKLFDSPVESWASEEHLTKILRGGCVCETLMSVQVHRNKINF